MKKTGKRWGAFLLAFALVLNGLGMPVLPVMAAEGEADQTAAVAEQSNPTQESLTQESLMHEDMTQANMASEDMTSEKMASEKSTSANMASEDMVSEDSASEKSTSANMASEDMASEDSASENLIQENLTPANLTQEAEVQEEGLAAQEAKPEEAESEEAEPEEAKSEEALKAREEAKPEGTSDLAEEPKAAESVPSAVEEQIGRIHEIGQDETGIMPLAVKPIYPSKDYNLPLGNVSWNLFTLDHGVITPETYKDKTVLFVFYPGELNEDGTAITNSGAMTLISGLAGSGWVSDSGIKVVAISTKDKNGTRDQISRFKELCVPDDENLVFVYGENYLLGSILSAITGTTGPFSYYPCFCVTVKEGKIRYVWDQCTSASECKTELDKLVTFQETTRTIELPAPHTPAEIQSFVNSHPSDLEQQLTYQMEPSLNGPYVPGVLSDDTVNAAVNLLNQVRYIAGLNANIKNDEKMAADASAGCLVNYLNDSLEHTPPRPDVLKDPSYDSLYYSGYEAMNRSNIASGFTSLNGAIIRGWCADWDESNIDRVGHRRWFLNPSMTKTGFGAAGDSNDRVYTAAYVNDGNFWNVPADTYVPWPAQKMPVQYFNSSYPWSVSLAYTVDPNNVSVQLKRLSASGVSTMSAASDGVWNFSAAASDGDFYVSTERAGSPACIIFRPKGITIQKGDLYDVTVTIKNGSDTTKIHYTVDFFDLTTPVEVSGVTLTPSTLTLKEGESGQLTAEVTPADALNKEVIFTSENNEIASVDAKGLVTGVKAGQTVIKVTTVSGSYTASCQVTVTHVHKPDDTWHTDGTHHWHECTAGDGEKLDLAEHSGGTADCRTKAVCAICHVSYGELGKHNLKETPATAPTHTQDGNIRYWTCSLCGKYFQDAEGKTEIFAKDLVDPATGHEYAEEWSSDASGHWHDCTAKDGGKTETEDHVLTWVTDQAATEEAVGQAHEECSVCHYKTGQTKEIPKLDHTHEMAYHPEVPATCTATGTAAYYECSKCGKLYKDEGGVEETSKEKLVLAMIPHSLVQHPEKAATCTEEGNIEYWTCSMCKAYFKDSQGKESIRVEDTVKEKVPHTEAVRNQSEPTCTEPGYTGDVYCTVCNQVLRTGQEIPAAGHDLVKTEAKAATHFEDGNIAYWTCNVCGKYFQDSEGTQEITEAQTVIAKGEHTYDGWQSDADGHWHKCTEDDYTTEKEDHELIWVTDRAATEEAAGQEHEECSICGYKTGQTKEIPKLDHTHRMTFCPEEPATCTKTGVQAHYKCEKCGKLYKDEEGVEEVTEAELVIPMTAHTEEKRNEKEATCKEEGYTGDIFCSVCGSLLQEGESIPIDPDHHTGETEVRNQKEATCTEDGYSGDTYCLDCGNVIEEGETIAAAGHQLVKVEEKEATHFSAGNIEYWYCTVCGEYFLDEEAKQPVSKEDVVIPQVAHSFSETWTADETNHWHACTCGEKADLAAHTFGDWKITLVAEKDKAGRRERTCSICGYVSAEVIPATSGNKTEGPGTTSGNHSNSSANRQNAAASSVRTADNSMGGRYLTAAAMSGMLLIVLAAALRKKRYGR